MYHSTGPRLVTHVLSHSLPGLRTSFKESSSWDSGSTTETHLLTGFQVCSSLKVSWRVSFRPTQDSTRLLSIDFPSPSRSKRQRDLKKSNKSRRMVYTSMVLSLMVQDGTEILKRSPISSHPRWLRRCQSFGSNLRRTIRQILRII